MLHIRITYEWCLSHNARCIKELLWKITSVAIGYWNQGCLPATHQRPPQCLSRHSVLWRNGTFPAPWLLSRIRPTSRQQAEVNVKIKCEESKESCRMRGTCCQVCLAEPMCQAHD